MDRPWGVEEIVRGATHLLLKLTAPSQSPAPIQMRVEADGDSFLDGALHGDGLILRLIVPRLPWVP